MNGQESVGLDSEWSGFGGVTVVVVVYFVWSVHSHALITSTRPTTNRTITTTKQKKNKHRLQYIIDRLGVGKVSFGWCDEGCTMDIHCIYVTLSLASLPISDFFSFLSIQIITTFIQIQSLSTFCNITKKSMKNAGKLKLSKLLNTCTNI